MVQGLLVMLCLCFLMYHLFPILSVSFYFFILVSVFHARGFPQISICLWLSVHIENLLESRMEFSVYICAGDGSSTCVAAADSPSHWGAHSVRARSFLGICFHSPEKCPAVCSLGVICLDRERAQSLADLVGRLTDSPCLQTLCLVWKRTVTPLAQFLLN